MSNRMWPIHLLLMNLNEETLTDDTKFQPVKYLNNLIEQDHCCIKRLVKPGLSFASYNTARSLLKGYEAVKMISKGQIKDIDRDDVTGQISFIYKIFGLAA